ncbi:NAD(P)/FAD-dependent oxidoreductase [Halanaerocella petrolearia]
MPKPPIPEGANIQQIKNGKMTYSITPHLSGGLTNAKTLKNLADVAEKYDCTVKVTSGQQIKLMGLELDQVEAAWADLDMEPKSKSGLKCKGVRFCPGPNFCKRGKVDSAKLGMALENKYLGMELPSRMKMGVSGCHFSCTAPAIRDIGIVGTEEGFELRVGGSGGSEPKLAKPLANRLNHDETLALVEKIINFYKQEGRVKERLGKMIERISWQRFKSGIMDEEIIEIIEESKFTVKDREKNFNSKCQHG